MLALICSLVVFCTLLSESTSFHSMLPSMILKSNHCTTRLLVNIRRVNHMSSTSAVTTIAIRDLIKKSLSTSFDTQIDAKRIVDVFDPIVSISKIGSDGDYQSNVAMLLSKQLGMKPQQLAVQIVENIESNDIVKSSCGITISGPGFINFSLSARYLGTKLSQMCQQSSALLRRKLYSDSCIKGSESDSIQHLHQQKHQQLIVVDYSSPNIAKEMHVGHMRSTIIGDCLSNIYEHLGHRVVRLNHVGDWGTQFGMLLHYLKQRHGDAAPFGSSGEIDIIDIDNKLDIGDIAQLYRESKAAFDADPAFREASRREVVSLQQSHFRDSADPSLERANTNNTSVRLWKAICAKSREGFSEIYSRLGITDLVERGESYYNPILTDLVTRLEKAGIAVASDDALVIFHDGAEGDEEEDKNENQKSNKKQKKKESPPLVIRKADGGYLYATTDLAAIWQRVQVENANQIVYVTDAGQRPHFEQVFSAAERSGLLNRNDPRWKNIPMRSSSLSSPSHSSFTSDSDSGGLSLSDKRTLLRHVPFGLVLGEDGKKISSRASPSSAVAEGSPSSTTVESVVTSTRLKDLLDEAVRCSEITFAERLQEGRGASLSLSPSPSSKASHDDKIVPVVDNIPSSVILTAEQKRVARILAIGAVKYADLSMHRESNYGMSYAKMLSLSGNTAPYLLYSYARLRGILRNMPTAAAEGEGEDRRGVTAFILDTPNERSLALHLHRFDETITVVERDLLPSKLCDYLYDLSQRFNRMYETCPVLKAESQDLMNSRVALCVLTADILKLGLDLLGIETVESI